MSPELLLALAALTYASRASALALLPTLPPVTARVLDRMPAPLFAGLAVASLLDPEGRLAGAPVLAASGGALLVAPLRSLPLCLLAGLAGYGLALLAT